MARRNGEIATVALRVAPLADERPAAIPADDEFGPLGLLRSERLGDLAERLIDQHAPKFDYLKSAQVVYLWRRRGGSSKGRPIYGQCQRPGALLRFFSGADCVIWLAADHCRQAGFTERQLEALLFHELCHTGTDERSGELVVVGHDFEGFAAEVRAYGLWTEPLQVAAAAVRQLPLEEAGDLWPPEAATPPGG